MTNDSDGVIRAVVAAHCQAECGDYYCGCWDQTYNDPEHKSFHGEAWPHTVKFLAALKDLGYEIVPAGSP